MQAQVEELEGNRVRLTVDVPGHDVKHAVEHAASDLAGNMKIPGFRQGKVPLPVLISRVGKQRLMTEAVESHIGGWFSIAAARNRIHPITPPEYEFELPSSDKDDWRFTATVEVQPKPEVPDWTQLEVARAETQVPEDAIEHELNVLRSTVAELAPVEGRPSQLGDTVVLDLVSSTGETQRDYVAELGAGRLVPEIEHGVVGMSAGETRTLTFPLSEEQTAEVEVTLKEVKEKVLPPLDDELARAASEFDTLDELRADIEARLREQLEDEVETAFRAAAIDALVAASGFRPAGPIVESRTRELANGLVRSVESRGIPFDTYLSLTGTTPEQLVERLRAEAAQSVARERVLEAVADELGLEVSDEEIASLIREQAEAAGDDPDAAVEGVRSHGGFERLRADLRMRNALDRIAAEVKPIEPELAQAREALWTPDKEMPQTETKLWTPGSKERA